MSKYSVVIPCYCSASTINKVVKMTERELEKLLDKCVDTAEFVLVNDCSPDGGKTISVLKSMAEEDIRIKVIDLGKNTGQHNAVMAALNYADGDYIIAMDDDMQTHPSQIVKLLNEMKKGYDIVYGFYAQKRESLFRRAGSELNFLTAKILLEKPRWLKTSSFWIIKKYVRDSIVRYTGPYIHLQGLFLRTTRNVSCVSIEHYERETGQSGYTLKKLMRLYSNILNYSVKPLKFIKYIGITLLVFCMITFLIGFFPRGKAETNCLMWFVLSGACLCASLVVISLSIIAEYLGRMFQEVSYVPQFVVKEEINISKGR